MDKKLYFKYRIASFIDILIFYLISVVITINLVILPGEDFPRMVLFMIIMNFLFFSHDFLLNDSSIGKKIMKIKITYTKRPFLNLFYSIIIRKIIECYFIFIWGDYYYRLNAWLDTKTAIKIEYK